MLANFNTKWMLWSTYKLLWLCYLKLMDFKQWHQCLQLLWQDMCKKCISLQTHLCSIITEDLEEYFLLAALGGDSDSHNRYFFYLLCHCYCQLASFHFSVYYRLQGYNVFSSCTKESKTQLLLLWAGSRSPWISRSYTHMKITELQASYELLEFYFQAEYVWNLFTNGNFDSIFTEP